MLPLLLNKESDGKWYFTGTREEVRITLGRGDHWYIKGFNDQPQVLTLRLRDAPGKTPRWIDVTIQAERIVNAVCIEDGLTIPVSRLAIEDGLMDNIFPMTHHYR
jgi:hypothetical protein